MVGPSRLELPTSRLSGARSNLLSYEPIFNNSVLLRPFELIAAQKLNSDIS